MRQVLTGWHSTARLDRFALLRSRTSGSKIAFEPIAAILGIAGDLSGKLTESTPKHVPLRLGRARMAIPRAILARMPRKAAHAVKRRKLAALCAPFRSVCIVSFFVATGQGLIFLGCLTQLYFRLIHID